MKKEKYFSPIFNFAATWCQEKKAKKKLPPPSENIHTIEFFLATLNSKIKKNEFSCPKKWNITTYSGKNITLKTANLISPK